MPEGGLSAGERERILALIFKWHILGRVNDARQFMELVRISDTLSYNSIMNALFEGDRKIYRWILGE